MVAEKLDKCFKINELEQFLETLTPEVGMLGGRYLKTKDGTSYSMNQIVYRFKFIVRETKPQQLDIIKTCFSIKKLEDAQIFEALNNPDNKTITRLQRYFTKIRSAIGNFIFFVSHNHFDRNAVLLSLSLGIPEDRIYIDNNRLLVGKNLVEHSHFAWMLNLGLLRVAEESATDEDTKKQIRFLASNFLKKSAPLQINTWKEFFKTIGPLYEEMCSTMFQVAPYDDYWYHREAWKPELQIGEGVNNRLAFGNQSAFVLMDSLECSHLFPLKFSVVPHKPSSNESILSMKHIIEEHLGQDPDRLKTNLKFPILFDFTSSLGPKMQTDGNNAKEREFNQEFALIKTDIKKAIDQTSEALIRDNPSFQGKEREIRKFIKKNIICISKFDVENYKGIKILPVSKDSNLTFKDHLIEFVHTTGLYLGAISLRREVLDAFARENTVRYAVPEKVGGQLHVAYYPKKEDFTSTKIFQRLSALFTQADAIAQGAEPKKIGKDIGISLQAFHERTNELSTKPHFTVLGKATMDLLEGLFQEIDLDTWNQLNQDPARKQILQASFMMIREHLAMAELYAGNDFNRFAQEIELVHAEIATILELTQPFKKEDFPKIYQKIIDPIIPEKLRKFCKVGLGKTAMNTFAGVNAAIMAQKPFPNRVYSENVYFESRILIGNDRYLKDIKNDVNSPPVDLYVAQFNPNVNTSDDFTDYKPENVIGNVRFLLASKKAAQHMTVAVDCTIDQISSPHVQKLLEEFKQEIADGKLNFVLFKSGQKFDMCGMDNYYGAPFYMINNGEKQWKEFNTLLTNPVHSTDSLSNQWFCLSSKYIADSLALYQELIFKNTRYILDNVPDFLLPNGDSKQEIRINRADPAMDSCFIDIKVTGQNRQKKSYDLMRRFYDRIMNAGVKIYSRQSFGFFHPSYLVFDLPSSEHQADTTRLTPGINPEDNEAIISFMKSIETF